jgi:hypothetical protein
VINRPRARGRVCRFVLGQLIELQHVGGEDLKRTVLYRSSALDRVGLRPVSGRCVRAARDLPGSSAAVSPRARSIANRRGVDRSRAPAPVFEDAREQAAAPGSGQKNCRLPAARCRLRRSPKDCYFDVREMCENDHGSGSHTTTAMCRDHERVHGAEGLAHCGCEKHCDVARQSFSDSRGFTTRDAGGGARRLACVRSCGLSAAALSSRGQNRMASSE